MVNVLVIGVTKAVGGGLTQSLIRSGNHRVFGFVKSAQEGQSYYSNEVTPIIEGPNPQRFLKEALNKHFINVVVDARESDFDTFNLLSTLSEHRYELIQAANNPAIPKLGFIYLGSTCVHGSSDTPVNDLTTVLVSNEPTNPVEILPGRSTLEKTVLASSSYLDPVIIRSAVNYGRASSMWYESFSSLHLAAQQNLEVAFISADCESRPALIHVDDVVAGMLAAVDKLHLVSGTGVHPVFDLVTSQESMRDIMSAAASTLGFKGQIMFVGCADSTIAKVISCSGNMSSSRARTILGWEPRRLGFVQNMSLYANAWLANAGANLPQGQ